MSTIANVEMAAAWDGHEGDTWSEHADRYEAAGRHIWRDFLARGLLSAHDHVLDIGCGTGKSTRDAARSARSGLALGVDLSSRMLEVARRRSKAEGLTNVRYQQADAQVHPFERHAFDVAISSFGAMFFSDPVAAFGNIGTALRPGGRLALLAWRELARNEWIFALRDALALGRELPEPAPSAPGPFGLADETHVRRVLEASGFDRIDLAPIDHPVEFGTDADDAFSFVRATGIVEGLTKDLDDVEKERALDAVRRTLEAHEGDGGVLFSSSAWLITARRL